MAGVEAIIGQLRNTLQAEALERENALKAELSEVKAQLEESRTEAALTQGKLEIETKRSKQLENDKKALANESTALKEQLKVKDSTIKVLEHTIEQDKFNSEHLENDIARLKEVIAEHKNRNKAVLQFVQAQFGGGMHAQALEDDSDSEESGEEFSRASNTVDNDQTKAARWADFLENRNILHHIDKWLDNHGIIRLEKEDGLCNDDEALEKLGELSSRQGRRSARLLAYNFFADYFGQHGANPLKALGDRKSEESIQRSYTRAFVLLFDKYFSKRLETPVQSNRGKKRSSSSMADTPATELFSPHNPETLSSRKRSKRN